MSVQRDPRVTIVTRTKDRSRLLGRAVQSVLAQGFADWQLIVVNDGGAPGDVEAVLAKSADDLGGRVRVIHNVSSRGMEAASNQGVQESRSEYVVIHDDDDEWAPDFLEETVRHLDAHPGDGGVAVQTEIVFERLTAEGREVVERVPLEPNMQAVMLADLLHFNRFVPISFLFRRSAYDALGGFDESLPVVGDWDFHLRFTIQYNIGYLKGRPLAFWNQRRESVGSEANSMIAGLGDHHSYALQIRDRLLREHVRAHGLGPLLYERELVAVEMHRLHEHLESVQRELQEIKGLVRDSTFPGTSRVRQAQQATRRMIMRTRGTTSHPA